MIPKSPGFESRGILTTESGDYFVFEPDEPPLDLGAGSFEGFVPEGWDGCGLAWEGASSGLDSIKRTS